MQINNKKSGLILTLIIILSLLISTFYMIQKQGFHEDELLTYNLSNSSEKLNIGGWNTKSDLSDYLSVNRDDRFNYGLVYENQKNDGVHPPLYYILIHTVCSFFSGTFSKWLAYSINLMSMAGALVLLYFLVRRLRGNNSDALITVCAYGLSIACITTTVYLRMYSLLTLLVLAFLYMSLKLYDKTGKASIGDYVLFSAIVLIGTLTHYYFILFELLTGIVFMIFTLKEKRKKDLLGYALSIAVGSALSLCFYPYIIANVISGNRGFNSFELTIDILTLASYVFYKLRTYIEIIAKELFLNQIWIFIICTLALLGYCIYRRIRAGKLNRRTVLAVFPAVAFFAGITVVSPFNSDRYIMACLPIIVMLYIFAFSGILKAFRLKKCHIIMAVGIALSGVFAFSTVTPYYIYGKTNLYKPVTKECVFVGTSILEWNKCIDKLMQYDNTMIVQTESLDSGLATTLEDFAQKRGIITEGRISEIAKTYINNSMEGVSGDSLSKLKDDKHLSTLDSVTVYISRLSDKNEVIKYITENTKFKNYELIQKDNSFEDYFNWYDYFAETESYCNVYRFY